MKFSEYLGTLDTHIDARIDAHLNEDAHDDIQDAYKKVAEVVEKFGKKWHNNAKFVIDKSKHIIEIRPKEYNLVIRQDVSIDKNFKVKFGFMFFDLECKNLNCDDFMENDDYKYIFEDIQDEFENAKLFLKAVQKELG